MPALTAASRYEVRAIHSRKLDNARAVAATFGVGFATDDYDRMIARDDLDLIVITTPPHLHKSMSIGALEAGKHVICEKPMAVSVNEAREMLTVAESTGLFHVIDHLHRYTPSNRQFHKMVSQGFLGELRYVEIKLAFPATLRLEFPYHFHSWRDERLLGGGLLSGVFSHYFDLARLCFGEMDEITGYSTTVLTHKPYHEDSGNVGRGHVDTDDCVAIAGRFASGALITLSGSWSVHHGPGIRIEAYGSEGTLVMPDPDTLQGAGGADQGLVDIQSDFPLPEGTHGHMGAFVHQLDDLAEAIHGTGEHAHYATFADGLKVQEFLETVIHRP